MYIYEEEYLHTHLQARKVGILRLIIKKGLIYSQGIPRFMIKKGLNYSQGRQTLQNSLKDRSDFTDKEGRHSRIDD